MKQLIIILMLFPLLGISQNRFKPLFNKADSAFNKSKVFVKEQYHIIDTTLQKKNFDSKDEYVTRYLIDQIGKYSKECEKDSVLVEYLKQPDYSKFQHTTEDGLIYQDAVFITPRKVKEYKRKEPTFIGFYE